MVAGVESKRWKWGAGVGWRREKINFRSRIVWLEFNIDFKGFSFKGRSHLIYTIIHVCATYSNKYSESTTDGHNYKSSSF